MITTYLIETRLSDGTLVDTIATVEGDALRDAVVAELQAERDEDTNGAIIGEVVVTAVAARREGGRSVKQAIADGVRTIGEKP